MDLAIIAFQIYSEISQKIEKGNNSAKKSNINKSENLLLDNHMTNFMSKFKSSRLNVVAKKTNKYYTNKHTYR